MSDRSNVRVLIADRGSYVKETVDYATGQARFQVQYMPLVAFSADGVIITLASGTALSIITNPFTVDYETGVITFTSTKPSTQTLTIEYTHVSLTDDSLDAILALNVDAADVVRLSAADALDAIASSMAVIEKKIKLLDMETDGPSVANALRDHAKSLREQVFSPDMVESTYDIAESLEPGDSPAFIEKVWKDALREQA